MRRLGSLVVTWLIVLGACAPEASAPITAPDIDRPVVQLDGSQVLAIAADFAIHKGLTEACASDEADHLLPFLDGLRDLPASADLILSSQMVASEMYDMARKEEPEYVCTPEMFEGVTERVAGSHTQWQAIMDSAG